MRNNESGKGTLLIDGEFQLGGAIYKFGNETFPYISEQEYRECNRFMKQSMKRGWRDNGGVPVVDATE